MADVTLLPQPTVFQEKIFFTPPPKPKRPLLQCRPRILLADSDSDEEPDVVKPEVKAKQQDLVDEMYLSVESTATTTGALPSEIHLSPLHHLPVVRDDAIVGMIQPW